MVLTSRDKTAIKITIIAWIVCGALAWILRLPALLLIALGVSWICSRAVIRVTPVDANSSGNRDDMTER
ncbi:MAG TPA: hypothetical protein VKQ06_01495 [Gammaproteobacteria bacterium]|nr:hypothetical protein [Gammaproteobacteria bacterium]